LQICQTGSSTPIDELTIQVKNLIEKIKNDLPKDDSGVWLPLPKIAGAKININATFIPANVPIEASESINSKYLGIRLGLMTLMELLQL
jgi:hypothetical protein